MAQGHHPIPKHIHKKGDLFLKNMDRAMYAIALIAPIMTIPQVIEVFRKHVQGVSLTTWSAYAGVSFLWLIYGYLHKDKPILITNFFLFCLDSAIVVGVLLFH